ncbi:hypothetical protein BH09ACT8_BH09ACT8_64810 [soil metagenome]
MSGEQITGSVALVEDEYTLVINRGAAAGVTPGMVFAVFSGDGRLITDPETGHELGRLDEEKLRVKVFEVRELFARAETFSTGAEQPRTYEIPIFNGTAELARYAGDTLVDDLPTSALSSCEVVTVNVGDAIQLVD